MHTKPMSVSDGMFRGWQKVSGSCSKCGEKEIYCRIWESSCGGYEDSNFKCKACGHSWWVDGSDA